MQQTLNGGPPTIDQLCHISHVNYGAYTSFRVEHGAVRGLDLHLGRLRRSAVDLFGAPIDEDDLRVWMRDALAGRAHAWMRVSLVSLAIGHRDPTFIGRPDVVIAVSDPPPPLAGNLRLQTRRYVREEPQHKHLATFGLMRARRLARADGFDDALFVGPDDLVSEGTLWNIGFVQGDTVVWPQAPMLAGVAQALIAANLGLPQQTRPVRVQDLSTFDAAFICNSATPAARVAGVDAVSFRDAPLDRLAAAWTAAEPQPI
jgi:branched-subunit amino acid aminotransferase/4-amino-4-deoxychorismate lyase